MITTQLTFSPSLASKIGLNEAILLQFLTQLAKFQGSATLKLNQRLCDQWLGFLTIDKIEQCLSSLQLLNHIQYCQNNRADWQIVLMESAAKPEAPTINNSIKTPVFDQQQVIPEKPSASAQTPVMAKTGAQNPNIAPQHHQGLNRFQTAARKSAEPQAGTNLEPQAHQPPTVQANQPVSDNNNRRQYNQQGHQLSYLQETGQQEAGKGLTSMTLDWLPSQQFQELLNFHNIPLDFAIAQLPRFRQYYVDAGRTAFSWDTRFISWVQRAFVDQPVNANNQQGQYDGQTAQSDAKSRKEKLRASLRDIQDTSWAD